MEFHETAAAVANTDANADSGANADANSAPYEPNTDANSAPYEPNEDERRFYYRGFPSQPRLVARTGSDRWVSFVQGVYSEWNGGRFEKTKHLASIGDEPIVRLWSAKLRARIIAQLDKDGLDWASFYPARIVPLVPDEVGDLPYQIQRGDCPVTLLIGVQPSTTTWAPALSCALACRALLEEQGILGVQVEVLESQVVELAESLEPVLDFKYNEYVLPGRPQFEQFAPYINSRILDLFPLPGQIVTQLPPSGVRYDKVGSGSLGLHIQLADDSGGDSAGRDVEEEQRQQKPPSSTGNGNIYALTSRHVAVRDRHDYTAGYSWIQGDDASRRIDVQWGRQDLGADAFVVRDQKGEYIDELSDLRYRSYKSTLSSVETKRLDLLENIVKQYADDLERKLERINTLEPSARTIGHVAFSAKHGSNKHGGYSDWALVRLSEEEMSLSPLSRRTNKAYIGCDLPGINNRLALHSDDKGSELSKQSDLPKDPERDNVFRRFQYAQNLDGQGFMRLRGISPIWPSGQRAGNWVAKRGMKTGTTYGRVNEIEAVQRRPLPNGQHVVSWALAIFEYPGDFKPHWLKGPHPFSASGDSGSCDFDLEGRVVGILDAGLGSGDPFMHYFKKSAAQDETLPHNVLPDQDVVPPGSTAQSTSSLLGAGVNVEWKEKVAYIDVTLVTPIQWILEDIESETGMKATIL